MNSQIHLQQPEASLALDGAISPMGAIWRTIRGYILWSYERGSLHYDIMVTLILLFIFVSPRFINFKDKPVERNPHLTGVVVIPSEKGGFVYQIQASAVSLPGLRAGFLWPLVTPLVRGALAADPRSRSSAI